MVRLPKRCGCDYCDWIAMTCKLYPKKIPLNIQLKYEKCKHYKLRIDYDDSNEDLPMAKGR